MNLNDFFSGNPARPDHPDFWKLSEIVLALDGAMQERGNQSVEEVISERAGRIGDSYSITYMALQRAMRAHGIELLPDLLAQHEEVIRTSVAYLEGMIVGASLERSRHE